MAIRVSLWEPKVRDHFGFLVERGFHRTVAEDSTWWATWVQYESEVSAVRIVYSVEYQRSEVELIRLVNGTVPEVEIWVSEQEINRTQLGNVVEVRMPARKPQAMAQRGLSDSDLDEQLSFWAAMLCQVAEDFLSGDLRLFGEVDALIRERLRRSPQQLTVWIPYDASAADEAVANNDAARTAPPGVGIVVRRYSKPGS